VFLDALFWEDYVLNSEQPTAAEISHPVSAKVTTQLKDIKKQLPLRVLSEDDWHHWITKGYVIVRNSVPLENAERLTDLLWEFDEKDPDDPSTWYAPERRPHVRKELNNSGMVEIYNHQYLWDNRMEQRVYDAFVDIWDRTDLWTTIDRANLNPPKQDQSGNPEGFVHWDVDTKQRPLPIGVQGVLSLKKQDGETGGFQCIPYLFEHFDEWVKTQPEDRNPILPMVCDQTLAKTVFEWPSISLCILPNLKTRLSAPNVFVYGAKWNHQTVQISQAIRVVGKRRTQNLLN
jgi:hypothetical protein